MDEVKFVKWPSIDNLETAKKTSRDYQKAKSLKNSWVVTEKIDGTNISINVTRDEVRVGKRTSLLRNGDSFYNVFQNLPKVEPLIRAMKEILDNGKSGIIVENSEEGIKSGLTSLFEDEMLYAKVENRPDKKHGTV